MRKLLVPVLMSGALVLGACGDDDTDRAAPEPEETTTTVDEPPAEASACSAGSLRGDASEPVGLPAEVAMVRTEILEAAVRCDYDLLESLSLRGDGAFSYSFGQDAPEGAGDFWRDLEEDGEDVLAMMVKALGAPHVLREIPGEQHSEYYSWPSADQEHPTDADWDALEAMYSEQQVEQFRAGGAYYGYRLGITVDGDWMYFIAGD